MSDETNMHEDVPFIDLNLLEEVDEPEVVDDEELETDDEEVEEMEMIETVEEDELQMVDRPTAGNRTVGQTHAKFQQIRQEKPAGKRKYMGKAKAW